MSFGTPVESTDAAKDVIARFGLILPKSLLFRRTDTRRMQLRCA
jgi:hypothetical protein